MRLPRGIIGARHAVRRLFAVYAAVSLVPVLILGATLLGLLGRQADAHGMAEARAKADLLAHTTIVPALDGSDLAAGLSSSEQSQLRANVRHAVTAGLVSRLRIRSLAGIVIFSDDGTGLGEGADDGEAAEAARGEVVSKLSFLNADAGDSGPRGPRVVETYLPLRAVDSSRPVGVLELYLPYAPIAADIAHGRRALTVALLAGLALLWVCLLAVSVSVTRKLRRQSAANGFLASHDALTGMPNRSQFGERAANAVAAATASRQVAVAVVDLDRFKEVNDTLGHGNGDRLLIMLAERLELNMREGDTIARLGGDEFGVVLSGLHGPGEAVEVLSRLRATVAEPLQLDGLPLAMEASIGFALAPDDGTDADALLQRADVAMYESKRQHLGVVHYRPDFDQYDSTTLTLVGELGQAIANGELVLHYQPKGSLSDGTVTAVEALVRWQHPKRGLLYPDAFLPAAEQTELIDELTRWVLASAGEALPALDPTGQLAVAINISARSLARADFTEDVLTVLAEHQVDPKRVILEITETSLMADPRRAARTLDELHQAGVRISIDDFGAGQTSLGYLATLPISELKIDKAFVLAMLSDERNAAIVRSVIELGHSLGFTVTAEGVETTEILQHLDAYRCDTVQGYLLARPIPSEALAAQLTAAVDLLDVTLLRPRP
ncbi:bifunctional diguanylate cyclase/phosphodiesterase [Jatrophihabitans telluris]|uniref:Bifunctional diguanylate cyclase/phosphodiesterase n=1 Tax=Jatrophihabitans telluris TaxID=2038343 RepID=A0ABY4QXL0_9ACTN|nr:bifunctional diguanylate cyclase/phosphodiesterase [Jatrophihabitans telluris]UQX88094.1 bifunctional diguanylate cyclase/phosphodiesterase [Jatrophihabitans telluris]